MIATAFSIVPHKAPQCTTTEPVNTATTQVCEHTQRNGMRCACLPIASMPTAMSAPPPRQRATWPPPSPPEEPLTSSLLQSPDVHYAIGDVLGVGRLGEVRAAVHRASGRAVVLRLFPPRSPPIWVPGPHSGRHSARCFAVRVPGWHRFWSWASTPPTKACRRPPGPRWSDWSRSTQPLAGMTCWSTLSQCCMAYAPSTPRVSPMGTLGPTT